MSLKKGRLWSFTKKKYNLNLNCRLFVFFCTKAPITCNLEAQRGIWLSREIFVLFCLHTLSQGLIISCDKTQHTKQKGPHDVAFAWEKQSILLPGILQSQKVSLSSARAGWRHWLRWAGPRLTSGCLSSPCKNVLLCPPTWRPPAPALSSPAPERSSPPHSARGSPSPRPSACACHRPERGGNSEPGPPANKISGAEVTSCYRQTNCNSIPFTQLLLKPADQRE